MNLDNYRLGSLLYYILFGKYPTDVKQEKNIIISDFHKIIEYNNIDDLKNHDFFININWNDLIVGKMNSPFKVSLFFIKKGIIVNELI